MSTTIRIIASLAALGMFAGGYLTAIEIYWAGLPLAFAAGLFLTATHVAAYDEGDLNADKF